MSAAENMSVRAFISYSWTSPALESWVMDLATRLVGDGVDVILDKWHLQPGHDANAFMEQMVTDRTVRKVLMICDQMYVEKANGRAGGVGKEAQILTAEIYEKTAQDKYVALPVELTVDGRPAIPTYYHSRQYISFIDPVRYEDRYQELVRWIYDKPQYVRPKIGTVPSYITSPDKSVTATTAKLKQAEHLIKTESVLASGSISDFGDAMVEEFDLSRKMEDRPEPWDEAVLHTVESLRPAVRNLSALCLAEARSEGSNFPRILRVLERIGAFMYRPSGAMSWSEQDFDAYRMLCYEAFLSIIAILLNEQRFDLVGAAIAHPYLISGRDTNMGAATASYQVFSQDVDSMRRRKSRIGSNRVDLFADVVADAYRASFPSLESLMQADLVLYLRGQIINDAVGWERWWPRTLLYSERFKPMEIFARSESLSFFGGWVPKVFGPISISDFQDKVRALNEGTTRAFGGMFVAPSILSLTNVDRLGIRG